MELKGPFCVIDQTRGTKIDFTPLFNLFESTANQNRFMGIITVFRICMHVFSQSKDMICTGEMLTNHE